MEFGICASVEQGAALRAAGADFLEELVQPLLQAGVRDDAWEGPRRVAASPLRVRAANSLLPGDLKIVGPVVDLEKVRDYIEVVTRRAKALGIGVLVFGSARARNIPDGFDSVRARRQIVDFLKIAAAAGEKHGVVYVIEPLSRDESNVIHTVGEAMTYVREVDHRNIRCLVDSFHFWKNGDSLSDLRAAMPWIRHVHVADKEGRVPPGESGAADYRPLFAVLKNAEYAGVVSVEVPDFSQYHAVAPRIIQYLKRQWSEA